MNELLAYDEKNLLKKISNGDEISFRHIYDSYHQKIYSLSFFLTRSHVLAEDMTQEVFVNIWANRENLSSINNFEKWLRIVVRNHAYNYLKRMAIEERLLKKEQSTAKEQNVVTENRLTEKVLDNVLKKTIDKLPPQQKKIYILSRQDGLKHDEIARLLNISINTVKNHLKAALFTIRSALAPHLLTLITYGFCFRFFLSFLQ